MGGLSYICCYFPLVWSPCIQLGGGGTRRYRLGRIAAILNSGYMSLAFLWLPEAIDRESVFLSVRERGWVCKWCDGTFLARLQWQEHSLLKCTNGGFWHQRASSIAMYLESRFETQCSIMHSIHCDLTSQDSTPWNSQSRKFNLITIWQDQHPRDTPPGNKTLAVELELILVISRLDLS